MSEQCPARLYFRLPGEPIDVDDLLDDKLVGVHTSRAGLPTAVGYCDELGLAASVSPELDDAATTPAEIELISDTHRGEAVLVITAHHAPGRVDSGGS